ncbi:GFA family protein [Mesorhizobium sp. B2-6-6]|nr:GFA family protein [Mesorhizobium sp. B2-6-6]
MHRRQQVRHESTKVTGGCLCGSVRYEAEVYLHNGYICHCTICQRSTGQPAEITVLVKAGTLRYLKDEPKYYASSDDGKRGFCGHCGSRIVWQASRWKDDWLTNITVGTLDRPDEARVTRHIYTDTQLSWYRVCEELPKLTESDAGRLIELLRDELRPELPRRLGNEGEL